MCVEAARKECCAPRHMRRPLVEDSSGAHPPPRAVAGLDAHYHATPLAPTLLHWNASSYSWLGRVICPCRGLHSAVTTGMSCWCIISGWQLRGRWDEEPSFGNAKGAEQTDESKGTHIRSRVRLIRGQRAAADRIGQTLIRSADSRSASSDGARRRVLRSVAWHSSPPQSHTPPLPAPLLA